MPTSAYCRAERSAGRRFAHAPVAGALGFTLLEILIVMALLGLATALVVPNLRQLTDSLERATRRDALLADIGGLGYRAWGLGQSFELDAASAPRLLRDGHPVLALPPGWRVEASPPIAYSFTGHCNGGSLTLRAPGGATERLVLSPPLCRVQP